MRKRTATLCMLFTLLLGNANLLSQQPGTLTEQSYARARQVIDNGMQALGGLKNFQAIENIHYTSSGRVPENGQSAAPDAPHYVRPLETEGVIDLVHRRYYQLQRTNYLGSGARGSTVVTTDKGGFTADLRANAVYPLGAPTAAAIGRRAQRTFPYQLLQLALNRAGTLRSLGEGKYEGRKQDVVSFIDAEGNLVTLFFDAQTGVLSKTEGLSDGFLTGLVSSETLFSDYRVVNGVRMPFHVVTRLGGAVTSDLSYTGIAFNTDPGASIFEMPKGAEVGPEVGGARRPVTVTKLGKDVYYVDAIETGGIFFYSAMFVAFNDYVLVVEAPLSDNVSQAIIAKIKETVPGKPIRYLVPTHYHIDHTGGVRGYVAEGSTIVTTPGNRRFFEQMAAVQHPLNPDRLSIQPRPASVETFRGKRVFTDGDHLVELYDVGPTPHVDEMVVAYFPREKLVFLSDLFAVSFKGQLGAAEPGTVLLGERIGQLGLEIRTIAGGHGRIATMDELRQSLAETPTPSKDR